MGLDTGTQSLSVDTYREEGIRYRYPSLCLFLTTSCLFTTNSLFAGGGGGGGGWIEMSIVVPIQAYWWKYCVCLIIRYYGVNCPCQ